MNDKYLNFSELKKLIKNNLFKNGHKLNLFKEIEEDISTVLRQTLDFSVWNLHHFLALITGFLYEEFYIKQSQLYISTRLHPNNQKEIFLHGKIDFYKNNLYLIEDVFSSLQILKRRLLNCFFLCKKKSKLYYLSGFNDFILVCNVDQKRLNKLTKNLYIQEEEPLSLTLEKNILADFYGLISMSLFLKTIDDIEKYYDESLATLHIYLKINKTPIEWLELGLQYPFKTSSVISKTPFDSSKIIHSDSIKGIKINSLVKKLITYKYYALDEKIADEGYKRPSTKDIQSTAKFLSKHLKKDVSEQDVLDLSVQEKFGVYINKLAYLRLENKESLIPRSFSKIEDYGGEGLVNKKYQYFYDGLTRLRVDGYQGVWSREIFAQSIKYIRDGGEIKITRDWFIVQLSLSEWVQGYNFLPYVLEEGLIITRKDLFFVEEELILYINTILKNNKINSLNKNLSASQMGSIGGKKSSERHREANNRAIIEAKRLWAGDKEAIKLDVAQAISRIFANNNITNYDQPYSISQIQKWIAPYNPRKAGRPKIKN